MVPSPQQRRSAEVVGSFVLIAVSYTITWVAYVATKKLLESYQETSQRGVASGCAEWLRRRHRRPPSLNEHEKTVAASVVSPDTLTCGLEDVGGLEEVVEEVRDLVVLPLTRPEFFGSGNKLIRAPRGLLFYGEPGTGKSLLARAVARDSGAALLNVRASTLTDKYFGESNKLVAAMFSLAAKLSPSIIFIDEIDGLLSARRFGDSDCSAALRAEFMTHLDGLLTEMADPGVVVLAATNRPYDLDPAILRRLGRQFRIGLPDLRARQRILALLLRSENKSVDLARLAKRTQGYSGSDLEELCRAAATKPIRDFCKTLRSVQGESSSSKEQPRPISEADFEDALNHVKPTAHQALAYRKAEQTPIFTDHNDPDRSPEID